LVRGSLQSVVFGYYTVHLSVTSDHGDVITVGRRTYDARTLWIAIIGDSFASGEGNPDVPRHGEKEAQWIDDRCHRSSKSFASTVFAEIAAVTPTYLTFLACTGATIENGILEASEHASQLDTLESIATKRGRGPDLVILTAGGNDIGFSDIINALVLDSARFDVSLIDMRFFFVSHQLDLVAKRLAALGTKNVFVPQYFDFTKNQHGEVDANCIASKEVCRSLYRELVFRTSLVVRCRGCVHTRKKPRHNFFNRLYGESDNKSPLKCCCAEERLVCG
uniref:SGNH_hydro domain-containing protein n=1 Tax=Angiostrongylus costaricensis TaxID=334426 RepID=A0A0R3Q0T8_ANGCS